MEEKYFDVTFTRVETYSFTRRVKARSKKEARDIVAKDDSWKYPDEWDDEKVKCDIEEVPFDDVVFLFSEGEIVAMFPRTMWGNDLFMCYAHIGQHSGCSIDWAKEQREATEEEYLSLKKELEDRGYILNIVHKDSL